MRIRIQIQMQCQSDPRTADRTGSSMTRLVVSLVLGPMPYVIKTVPQSSL
jgi:hypothetical protein